MYKRQAHGYGQCDVSSDWSKRDYSVGQLFVELIWRNSITKTRLLIIVVVYYLFTQCYKSTRLKGMDYNSICTVSTPNHVTIESGNLEHK